MRAAEAAVSLRRYGQALFEQLFGDRAAYARYLRLLEGGLRDVTIAISGFSHHSVPSLSKTASRSAGGT